MKLELQLQDFLKAWQSAEKIVPAKTTQDVVSCIRLKANELGDVTLEATDFKTSVKCKADGVSIIEPGTAVLTLPVFGSMIKKLAGDTATLEVSNSRGTLSSGGSKARFAVMPFEEFPAIPASDNAENICEVTAADLARIINEGSAASSQPQDFPRYLGTCMLKASSQDDTQTLKAVSTDGKRLSLSEVPCTVFKNEELLLPSPALKDLAKQLNTDETVRIMADASTVWFCRENIEHSIRRIEASFPNYERILSDEYSTKLRISRDDLVSAIERIDIIAKANIPAHVMSMNLEADGTVTIKARAPELGTATEILTGQLEDKPLQVGYNVTYFLDGLKALGAGDIVIFFAGDEGQTRMTRSETNDFLYMLMPARLAPQDLIDDESEEQSVYENIPPAVYIPEEQEPQEPEENYDVPDYDPETDML